MPISPSRLAFLVTTNGPQILQGLLADRTLAQKPYNPTDAVEHLLTCDPTMDAPDKAGRYATWLCQVYIKEWKKAQAEGRDNAMLSEDLPRLRSHLAEYDLKKHKLPAHQRDIMRLSLDDLREIAISIRERKLDTKGERRNLINSQTTILYNGPEGLIVTPHNTTASCFWGLNTEWCTAFTEQPNKFSSYNKSGPLIILIPSGENQGRYQIHVTAPLKNQNDKTLEPTDIPVSLLKLLNAVPKELYNGLQKNSQTPLDPSNVKSASESHKASHPNVMSWRKQAVDWNNKEAVLQLMSQDWEIIKRASPELRADRNFILTAIAKNASALRYASPELRADRNIVQAAVSKDGFAIQYASPALQADRDLANLAVSVHPLALEFVSPIFREDRDFVLSVISRDIFAYRFASKELRSDHDFLLTAISIDPLAYKFASKELQGDREIFINAMSKDVIVLESAPAKFRADSEIMLTAISKEAAAIALAAPELLVNASFIAQALQRNADTLNAFKYLSLEQWSLIPEKIKQNAYEKLLRNNWQAISNAADIGISISPNQEFALFIQAKNDKAAPLEPRHFHLFPSLRNNGAFMTLDMAGAEKYFSSFNGAPSISGIPPYNLT